MPLPDFALRTDLAWLSDVSVWSAPPKQHLADERDAFLLGGGGHLSARLGVLDRVSTMERIMAPYLSSYNFAENVNFRKDIVRPSRDFYPPFRFEPKTKHVWRVRNTAIVITAERDEQYELVTVSAVHPTKHVYLRHASLKNISTGPIRDIGIGFEAEPDIPFPIAGHRSKIYPLSDVELLERLEELAPIDRDYSPNYGSVLQRHRFLWRGIMEGKARGHQDLFTHCNEIASGEAMTSTHILAPGLHDTEQSAIDSGQLFRHQIEVLGEASVWNEIYQWWMDRASDRVCFDGDNKTFVELLENNAVLQTSVERATGGFVVIDDYTGSWLRDHNGSHLFELDLGLHLDVRRSMDRYYGLDVSNRALYSVYASDSEPQTQLPQEPDWESVDGFVTGDVPNFRTLWYWWWYKHTGDLSLVRDRFHYLKGAFMRQKLHDKGYLAEYCFDETYGIGPVGPMRRGFSADNSFIALAAARKLALFATLLGRDDAEWLASYASEIHNAIERTFWLETEQYYAMRLTPEGVLDKTPLSIGLLRPIWTGSAEDSPEHAELSALYAIEHLYSKNGFVRLIPTHDQTVTMAIGYLLFAAKKMSHPELDRILSDVLKWADPSGTFGEYLDERDDGPRQCYEHMAHRNRMWESGINSDAVIYALTGFDPHAYDGRVRFAPHLPKGWKHFEARNFLVGVSRVSFREELAKDRTHVTISHTSGEPLTIEVQLTSARTGVVLVDGKESPVQWSKNRFGVHTCLITKPIRSGHEILISY